MASDSCAFGRNAEPKLIAPGAEPLDDFLGRFDFIQRDRLLGRRRSLNLQQSLRSVQRIWSASSLVCLAKRQ